MPPGAGPQRGHDRLGAAQVIEPRGVGGGTRNPARKGDLLTLKPVGRTLAVPPLDRLLERPLDARSETHPPRSRAGHLTAAGVEPPAELLTLR